MIGRCCLPRVVRADMRMIGAGLALGMLIVTAACAPGSRSDSTRATAAPRTPTVTRAPSPTSTSTPTVNPLAPTVNPLARIHNAQPGAIPLFVRITFTPSTTYEQAVAVLESVPTEPYPWTCDDPRSTVPPPPAERQAAYDAAHSLLLSYARWEQLTQVASLPQVVSVDGTTVFLCP